MRSFLPPGRAWLGVALILVALLTLSYSVEMKRWTVTDNEIEGNYQSDPDGGLELIEDLYEPEDEERLTRDYTQRDPDPEPDTDEEQDEEDPHEVIMLNSPQERNKTYVNSRNETVKIWRWTQPRRNILFIKIPKTGGTTLHDSIARLVYHSNWVLAKPTDGAKVDTCGNLPDAEKAWSHMLNVNGGRIGAFASHACYRRFMKSKRSWVMRRVPAVFTVVRHPWSLFVSKFRFTQWCCEKGMWSWCKGFCVRDGHGKLLDLNQQRYKAIACSKGRCNVQQTYMGSGRTEDILNEYGLVIILERFDEGLAMLAVKFGFPFQALPYLKENANIYVKMPNFSASYKQEIQTKHMKFDMDLYHAAKVKFDHTLQSLTPEESAFYNLTYNRLRVTNKLMTAECDRKCGQYGPMTQPKKICEDACIAEFLDTLD